MYAIIGKEVIEMVFEDWKDKLKSQSISDYTKSAILYYMYKEGYKLEPQTREYFDLVISIENTITDLLTYKLPFVNEIDNIQIPEPKEFTSAQVQMLTKSFVSLDLIRECIQQIREAQNKDKLREVLMHYKGIIDKVQDTCVQRAQQEIGLLDDYARYKISTFKIV